MIFTHETKAEEATIPQVKIYNSTFEEIQAEFLAYQEGFRGGVNIAAGDVDGDGTVEVVTGAGVDGGPQVRIFDDQGQWTGRAFFAYGENFRGGVKVATGDINGDGTMEIITGTGKGGGPQIRVFSYEGTPMLQFFAYGENFRGGVNVAAGDLDGDGLDEIISGAGFGGGPQIRVFNQQGEWTGWDVFAFHPNSRNGINVAAGDLDGDGQDEIGACQPSDSQAWCKIYEYNLEKEILVEWNAFGAAECGASIAMGDINGDGKAEVILAAGPTGGPHVRLYNQEGAWAGRGTFAYHKDFRGGLKVASGDFDGDGKTEIITAPGRGPKRIVKCESRCIALTFDDGYDSGGSYERILDILKRRNVSATFFILGKMMEARPDLVKRIVDEGHQLANHSYSHGFFPKMPEDQIRWEINHTDEIARGIVKITTKPYFRYPYGSRNDFTNRIIHELGYRHVQWTIDSYDSRAGKTSSDIYNNTMNSLHDGANIVYHTQSRATVDALDQIITSVQSQGYQLVTVAQLPPPK